MILINDRKFMNNWIDVKYSNEINQSSLWMYVFLGIKKNIIYSCITWVKEGRFYDILGASVGIKNPET